MVTDSCHPLQLTLQVVDDISLDLAPLVRLATTVLDHLNKRKNPYLIINLVKALALVQKGYKGSVHELFFVL